MDDKQTARTRGVCRFPIGLTLLTGLGCLGFAGWATWLAPGSPRNGHMTYEDMIMLGLLWSSFGTSGIAMMFLPFVTGCAWNDKGISRPSARGPKTIAWANITDYYLVPSGRAIMAVVESRGDTFRVPAAFAGFGEFKDAVARNASVATAGDWAFLGCRPEDPRELSFAYPVRQLTYAVAFFSVLLAGCLIALIVQALPHIEADARMGAGWVLGDVGALCFLIALYGILFAAITMPFRNVRPRKDQVITTSPAGIHFGDQYRDVGASWAQVRSHRRARLGRNGISYTRFVIETEAGTFDFTLAIARAALLVRILEHWSPAKGSDDEPDILAANEAAYISSPQQRERVRVFHYRTRTNRALLLFFGAYCFLPAAGVFARGVVGGPGNWSPSTLAIFEGILIAGFLWCLWRYRAAAILLDDDGVTQRTAFGERRILWPDIIELRRDQYTATVMGRNGKTSFYLSIADAEALLSEIRKRAPRARTVEPGGG